MALDVSSFGGDKFGRGFMTGPLAELIGAAVVSRPILGAPLTSRLMRRAPITPPGFVREPARLTESFELSRLARRRGYFDGYWQDERFIAPGSVFADWTRAFILDQATPQPPAGVVMHYRTYKEENHPVFSQTPVLDYFQRAIGAIEDRIGPFAEIIVVSDDTDLAAERLAGLGKTLIPSPKQGWADDMARLMNARALILTNSSFSWWAGYCGGAEITTYPERGTLFHYPIPAKRFACL